MNMEIDKQLKEAIENNKLVVFAGAGVSKYLGFPNWEELLIRCLNHLDRKKYLDLIKQISNNNDLVKVFDQIDDKDKIQIKRHISQTFRRTTNNAFELHKSILRLTSQIITTNYDQVFENAYYQLYNVNFPNITVQNYDKQNLIDLLNSNEFIFYLHGNASSPESCAVFTSDYNKIYNTNSPSLFSLQALATNKVILFIGFSFKDKKFKKVLLNHSKMFNGSITHYILTPNPADFEKINFLTPIEKKYDEFIDFISALTQYKIRVPIVKPEAVIQELKKTLSYSTLFRNITPNGINHIALLSDIFVLSRGEYLCREGDAIDSFWLILDGKIEAKKKGITTTVRGDGDVIGELGLLKESNERSSDLIAEKHKTKVVEIKLDYIHKLSSDDLMTFWKNLSGMLSMKIQTLDNLVCQLQHMIENYKKG